MRFNACPQFGRRIKLSQSMALPWNSRPRLRLHRARPERLFHPLGDLAQIGVARLAAGAAGIEVALEAVALRPMFGEKLEARLLDRLDRPENWDSERPTFDRTITSRPSAPRLASFRASDSVGLRSSCDTPVGRKTTS